MRAWINTCYCIKAPVESVEKAAVFIKRFSKLHTHEDLLDNAKDVIESSGVPDVISERALGRFHQKISSPNLII